MEVAVRASGQEADVVAPMFVVLLMVFLILFPFVWFIGSRGMVRGNDGMLGCLSR